MRHARLSLPGRFRIVAAALAAGLVWSTAPGLAQQQSEDVPDWAKRMAADPESPAMRAYAAQQKQRLEVERELKKLRLKHFGSITNVEIRQAGISKLSEYTDPAIFPSLVEIFHDEKDDVRFAVLDHLADQRSEEADVCLAWIGVHDKSPELQAAATKRVATRVSETGGTVPSRIALVVYTALRSSNESVIAGGAQFAQGIGFTNAIPWLISAQLGRVQSEPDRDGDLAWIVVGKQVAFVSDLTPVVAESAVAFDPQLSVVTEGVLLRVHDAVVITYRTEVHNALIGLSEHDWGRATRQLGWDQDAWREWYTKEYVPYRRERDRTLAAAKPVEGPK